MNLETLFYTILVPVAMLLTGVLIIATVVAYALNKKKLALILLIILILMIILNLFSKYKFFMMLYNGINL